MRTFAYFVAAALTAGTAAADTLVATRTLRAQTVIGIEDVALTQGDIPGGVGSVDAVLGLETRVAIFQGRPIIASDLGPPAIVDRNQPVRLSYRAGPLTIAAEGRALARGGVGDRIKAMNIDSRTTVIGIVAEDGSLRVDSDIRP